MTKTAQEIVDMMFDSDAFSQWLGIERSRKEGSFEVLSLKVRKEMLNGFGIAHGAITYALADSALAFACNGHGLRSVSVQTSIHHTKKVMEGDVLRTQTVEEYLGGSLGVYNIQIVNQNDQLVAVFKGTVQRSKKAW